MNEKRQGKKKKESRPLQKSIFFPYFFPCRKALLLTNTKRLWRLFQLSIFAPTTLADSLHLHPRSRAVSRNTYGIHWEWRSSLLMVTEVEKKDKCGNGRLLSGPCQFEVKPSFLGWGHFSFSHCSPRKFAHT